MLVLWVHFINCYWLFKLSRARDSETKRGLDGLHRETPCSGLAEAHGSKVPSHFTAAFLGVLTIPNITQKEDYPSIVSHSTKSCNNSGYLTHDVTQAQISA